MEMSLKDKAEVQHAGEHFVGSSTPSAHRSDTLASRNTDDATGVSTPLK